MSTVLATISSLFESFLGWVADITTALFSPVTGGADLSILGAGLLLGLVCAVILFSVKVIRKVFWGA